MIVVFLFAFLSKLVFSQPNVCCKLNTPQGMIDLNPIKGKYYAFPLEILQYHNISFTLCQNLDEAHKCVAPTKTVGPTPFKDEYRDESCYYVGGLNMCTFDQWNAETSTSILYYPGVVDQNNETRSAQFTLHCNMKTKGIGVARCAETQEHDRHTVYICDVDTEFACPAPFDVFGVLIGVGGIIIIVLVFLLILYFVIGLIVYFVRKFALKHDVVKGNHPLLFFDLFVKEFLLSVWEGCLMFLELGQNCVKKIIQKTGGYDQLEE